MNKLTLFSTLLFKNTPVYVHYGITHRCNLRCRMCGVWKTGDRETELSVDQIDRMSEILHKLGTQVISIGGGEPLVREDLPEAVGAFIKRGISVRILSNGVIEDYSRLQKVIDAGAVNFSISLDTLDPDLQNDIIGRQDAFNRVMDTLLYLAPILKEKNGLGLINTVVSSANLDCLPDLVDFAEKIGFYVSFVPLEVHQFSGKLLGCTETMQDLTFTQKDREKAEQAFNELVALKAQGKPVFNSSSFLKCAGKYMSGKEYKWDCRAGTLYFSISPEGYFSVCHHFSGYTMQGSELSILDPDFLKIFKSKEYKNNAKKIQSECLSCLRPCWAEISYLFNDYSALIEMMNIQFGKSYPKKIPTRKEILH
ncbi:MAG: radical SAM protein [Candidatus Eremiobacteraeota bacterium]|nr:radical SAM protein [Candidatus Eremiobacteraeota bacterium]